MTEFATELGNCLNTLGDDDSQAPPRTKVRRKRSRLLPALVGCLAIAGLIAWGVYHFKRPPDVPDTPLQPGPPEPTPGVTWTGHTGNINAMALSADGTRAASGDSNGLVLLWDVKSGKSLERFKIQPPSDIYCIALSRDGKQVAAGTADGDISLWLSDAKAEVKRLKGHRDSVHSVSFSPNGEQLLSGSADGNLKLWNLRAGKVERDFAGEVGIVRAAFIRDGKQLLSGLQRQCSFLGPCGGAGPGLLRTPGPGMHRGGFAGRAEGRHVRSGWKGLFLGLRIAKTDQVAAGNRRAVKGPPGVRPGRLRRQPRRPVRRAGRTGPTLGPHDGCPHRREKGEGGVLTGGGLPRHASLASRARFRRPQTGTPILIHDGVNR